jgi:glycosyltransferase involved in cell wall biosynthesis
LRILHTVEFYHPSTGGMQEVVKQLSERLVKLGHQVTVVTSKLPERTMFNLNGVNIVEFDVAGNAVRGMSGELSEYQDYLLTTDVDVITNFAAQQWTTDLTLPLLDQLKMKKIFVPTGFSGLYLPEYQEYYQEMKTWMKSYDHNIFLSRDYKDIDFAKEHGITKYSVIPNGASEEEFGSGLTVNIRAKLGIPADHYLILHVGSHTGWKGHREAREIFKAANIRNAVFLMVANHVLDRCSKYCYEDANLITNDPQQEKLGKRFVVTELSREETVEAYKAADLFLFPSNIECSPLVLFECMASKTFFLSSDVGNAKEICQWAGSGEILPTDHHDNGCAYVDVQKSTRILEAAYQGRANLARLTDKAYVAWQDDFTWGKLARRYEDVYY